MTFDWAKLAGSVPQFLEVFRIVRLCPDEINAPDEKLSLNLTTLAIVLAIFVIARRSIAGASGGVASDMLGTVVSASVMFVTGFVILIIDNTSDVMTRVRKWGMFFVLTWIISLVVVIVIDGIAIWNHRDPLTTIVIDSIFVPGTLSPLIKNSFRALVMGLIALSVLLVKTRINCPQFRIFSRCSLTTVLAGLVMNTLLLLAFLYSDLI
jgi:hypothetical protein